MITCLDDLKTKAKELFQLESAATIVHQRYDKEFNEFVDIESYTDICSGDKINLVITQKSALFIEPDEPDGPNIEVICDEMKQKHTSGKNKAEKYTQFYSM